MRGNPHELQLGAHREALVESQPDERAHLSWVRVVPDSGDHLGGCGVLEVEALYEGEHVGGAGCFSGIFVSPFGGVAEEGCIHQRWVGLPVPFAWVPWEVLDEPYFKYLI